MQKKKKKTLNTVYCTFYVCSLSLTLSTTDETHHIVTGWVECFGSTNIHTAIFIFMKNSDIVFALILKKKTTMWPWETNKWCDLCVSKDLLSILTTMSNQAEPTVSLSCVFLEYIRSCGCFWLLLSTWFKSVDVCWNYQYMQVVLSCMLLWLVLKLP